MYRAASLNALYLRLEHKDSITSFIVSQLAAIQYFQMKTTLRFVHVEGGFFSAKGVRRGNKGEDADGVRENISEEDPPPWVDVQEKLFPRNRQICLYEKIPKKFGMTQRVIRERGF